MKNSGLQKIVQLLTISAFIIFTINTFAFAHNDFDWMWFVYEKGSYYDSAYTVYRPLYLKNIYNNGSFTASLMPVICWKYVTPRQHTTKGIFGFYEAVDYWGQQHYENDTGLFPLVLYGVSTDEKDRYFHLWPFGGTLKGKLATDSITTYVFPGVVLFFLYPTSSYYVIAVYLVASLIPVYVHYTSKDYDAHGILWPLIQWGKSPLRDDLRIMPLYAHSKKKGFYDTYSYGLLYNVRKEYIGNDIMNTVFFVPLYARRWLESGKAEGSSLLWPFFSWGYNDKHGNLEINFPWPLVQLRDCDDPYIYKRIFFPFYGKYIERNKSTFFVTPLYFVLEKQSSEFESQYSIYGILFWYFKRDYTQQHQRYGRHWRFYKLWPLFHYEYNDRGDSSFAFLSILPFRDEEGYERLYQPFFSIVEYSKQSNGDKRFGLLLRTYFQSWNENYFTMKIPFIISYSVKDSTMQNISLLMSFFSYTDDDTVEELRIGWIPIYRNIKDKEAYNAKQKKAVAIQNAEGGATFLDHGFVYAAHVLPKATVYVVRF
ncbi:MAG: hypothetical protein N3F66_05035 [Spirochaetes bacterium]|nr:hypothetical protein [Spirochaetota bacterium]